MPATCDLGSAYRQNNSVSKPRSSGGSVKTSASTPRTPHSTHTIHASNSNTALSGARFYVDPDLPDDLQAKVARLCSLPPIEHIIGLFKFMLVFLFFNYLFLLFLSSSPLYLISLFAMLSDPMELFQEILEAEPESILWYPITFRIDTSRCKKQLSLGAQHVWNYGPRTITQLMLCVIPTHFPSISASIFILSL